MKKFWLQQARSLVIANMKSRYRNTFTGFVWVVLNPILIFGAQALVFHHILKINVDHYPLFLLSGLIPWIFIVQSVDMGTSVFANSNRLLKSFPIHPFVLLISQLWDNFFNFIIGMLVIFSASAFIFDFELSRGVLLPLCAIPLFLFTMGVVMFLATLQVFFWDTRFIVTFVMNFVFYLTPIIYPVEFIDPKYQWLFELNPLRHIIHPFQVAVSGTVTDFPILWFKALGLGVAVVGLAGLYWRRSKYEFYFSL